jgi:hypothetical protein
MASDSLSASFGGEQLGRFNSPKFAEDSTEVVNKPITTAQQAYEVFCRLQRDNQARANRNKLLADAYNGAAPFDQKKLDNAEQGWRANFSTLCLSTFVDRVVPRLTDTVHAMKYLTASELPDSFLEATNKTQKFRERTTEQIRSWNGWIDYVEQVACENVIYGYTGAVQMDEFEWRPQTFRQEDVLFDEQAPQLSDKLPVFVIKANYYIHECVEIIEDAETAAEAGYNVDNIKVAIEKAAPPTDSMVYNPRQLSDMVREGNLFYSFHRSSKMVETAHIFVKCYDNSVDHWWVNRNGSKRSNVQSRSQKKKAKPEPEIDPTGDEPRPMDDDPYELAYFESVCESMADAITLFSFQAGNNRLFGSKGIGRLLYNISLATEKARMSFIDAMYISGLLVGQAEESIIGRLQPHVRSPFLIVPEGFQLLMQQFRVDVNNWLGLDQKLINLSENIAGAFLPNPDQVSNNGQVVQTATASSIDAVKEEQVQSGLLSRWWVQFGKGVGAMQRRIYSKTNLRAAMKQRKAKLKAADTGKTMISKDLYSMMTEVDSTTSDMFVSAPDLGQADEASVDTIMALLDDGLSVQEIIILAHEPATEVSDDTGPDSDMKFTMFYQLAQNSQNFDKAKVDEMAGNRLLGFKACKELYVPQPGQTTEIEAQRSQQMEWATMLGSGIGVQVSQRDPHMQHFSTLVPAVADHLRIASQMPPVQIPKDLLNACKLGATHCEAHIQAMMQQGANKRQLRPQILQLKDLEKMLNELVQKVQQAEMMAAQMQMLSQQTGGMAGVPGGPGGPPGVGTFSAGGGPPLPSGPMGLPMGNNAAGHPGLGPPPGMNGNGAAPPALGAMAGAQTGGGQ